MEFIVSVGTFIAECLLHFLNQSPFAVPITTSILVIFGTGIKRTNSSIEDMNHEGLIPLIQVPFSAFSRVVQDWIWDFDLGF